MPVFLVLVLLGVAFYLFCLFGLHLDQKRHRPKRLTERDYCSVTKIRVISATAPSCRTTTALPHPVPRSRYAGLAARSRRGQQRLSAAEGSAPAGRERAAAGQALTGKYDARRTLRCTDNCFLRDIHRVREILREDSMNFINGQSIAMLIVTALTMLYLFYALLRPEKF